DAGTPGFVAKTGFPHPRERTVDASGQGNHGLALWVRGFGGRQLGTRRRGGRRLVIRISNAPSHAGRRTGGGVGDGGAVVIVGKRAVLRERIELDAPREFFGGKRCGAEQQSRTSRKYLPHRPLASEQRRRRAELERAK